MFGNETIINTCASPGIDKAIAKLTLLLAKAVYQVDDEWVQSVFKYYHDEQSFIGTLAWAACTSARRIAYRVSKPTEFTETKAA